MIGILIYFDLIYCYVTQLETFCCSAAGGGYDNAGDLFPISYSQLGLIELATVRLLTAAAGPAAVPAEIVPDTPIFELIVL